MIEVITRYVGSFRKPAFNASGDSDHMQVALLDLNTGKEEVIFTGNSFSQELYEENGGQEREEFYREMHQDFKRS